MIETDEEEIIVFLFENGDKKKRNRAEKIYGLKGKNGMRPVAYRAYNFTPTERERYDFSMHLHPMWSR